MGPEILQADGTFTNTGKVWFGSGVTGFSRRAKIIMIGVSQGAKPEVLQPHSSPSLTSSRTMSSPHAQAITPDSPGVHGRSSYIYSSDTARTRPNSMDIHEKYDHTRHLEQANQASSDDDLDHITEFPNKWAKFRYFLREPAAEFLGGGHINPAVTLAQAIFRGFSWKKVPSYILAQTLGACTGAGLVYANYHRAIDLFEGGLGVRTVPGTASLFTTFALAGPILGTAILLIVVAAVTDKRNGPPPSGLVPLVIFITILGEGACLGMQTAYAINPARDLGPRLMCWMAGYGREVWNYRSQYWLYTPIIGPIVGAILGTAIYDAFLFTGSESIFNKPDAATRRRRLHAPAEAKGKIIPSGEDAV
ncbi:MIP domain-containing protein [Rhizoctonia solani AG-1 IA]|uniref:MIP domain-containing protein n=1 Tax=Thanatephorus cucumeris (strain AG1-IA) TaxID=983506 RepID=L8X2A8_THACA|nr:MIP domain-containing protein [Rhizoctonia solani AG-1 IA]